MNNKKAIVTLNIDKTTVLELKRYYSSQFDFFVVESAEQLTAEIEKHQPILIFLSNRLPDVQQTRDFCIALRSQPFTETVPVIMIAQQDDREEKIDLLRAGLIDGYFGMPVDIAEIAAYSNVFLQRQSLQEELEEKNRLLSQISVTDDLMGINNRRFLFIRLEEELKRAKRYVYDFSAMMIDIDFFKKINDSFGHQQGDRVLEKLAALLKASLRFTDTICRYGGEEIIVLMPHTNLEESALVAERIRRRVEMTDFNLPDARYTVTISAGVVGFNGAKTPELDFLLQTIDQLLYKAKNGGRNRVTSTVL